MQRLNARVLCAVTFDTTEGEIKAELFMDKMPVTASNFKDLAESGYYDGMQAQP